MAQRLSKDYGSLTQVKTLVWGKKAGIVRIQIRFNGFVQKITKYLKMIPARGGALLLCIYLCLNTWN